VVVNPTGYWTFFCNPAKWAADEFLSRNIEYDSYSITKWQSEWFKPGQLGIMRVGVDTRNSTSLAGKKHLEPGVYAIVEVLSHSRNRGSAERDIYWLNSPPNPKSFVVDIRYLKNLLLRPLSTQRSECFV
jgi:hypothetical protein